MQPRTCSEGRLLLLWLSLQYYYGCCFTQHPAGRPYQHVHRLGDGNQAPVHNSIRCTGDGVLWLQEVLVADSPANKLLPPPHLVLLPLPLVRCPQVVRVPQQAKASVLISISIKHLQQQQDIPIDAGGRGPQRTESKGLSCRFRFQSVGF